MSQTAQAWFGDKQNSKLTHANNSAQKYQHILKDKERSLIHEDPSESRDTMLGMPSYEDWQKRKNGGLTFSKHL